LIEPDEGMEPEANKNKSGVAVPGIGPKTKPVDHQCN
jgi:hypothetical protein